jgi:multimeric flavodoxin WrbA
MTNLAIAYHSGFGHTALVAQSVAEGARKAGATVHLVNVETITEADWQTLDAADGIIFGCPTYMGCASGTFQMFLEATSRNWVKQGWKDKIAAGFTNSGTPSGDKVNTLQTIGIVAAQHSMVWVTCGTLPSHYTKDGKDLNRLGGYLGLMTQSADAAAGPENPPAGDHESARIFGARVAEATQRWGNGR